MKKFYCQREVAEDPENIRSSLDLSSSQDAREDGRENIPLTLLKLNVHEAVPARLKRLRQRLKENNLDSFVTENYANHRYLTGFTGSESWLVVNSQKAYLLVDSRYTLQAKREVSSEIEVVEIHYFFQDFWHDYAKQFQKTFVGYESKNLTADQLSKLKKYSLGLKLIPTENLVEKLRAVKQPGEMALIKKAVRIADQALEYIREVIKPGLTEREISWEVEKFCRENGAEKMAWEPVIVASGENAALPHHKVSDRKIRQKDMILFDFGAVVEGYHSDVSRVLFVGGVSDEQRRVYEAVLEGQKLARDLVCAGVKVSDVDRRVKENLRSRSNGVYGHALGHGLGLEVHEFPVISQTREDLLESTNVVTVEPGIYLPEWGGVRIEDVIVVNNAGCETLTRFPKDLKDVTL
ncbi:MAG: Xaa-Pro peptidase family protein [Patescibacteria group bacterium]|nr:Xaa-Pro peptidase family protein [Patescibacteria group bacterium]